MACVGLLSPVHSLRLWVVIYLPRSEHPLFSWPMIHRRHALKSDYHLSSAGSVIALYLAQACRCWISLIRSQSDILIPEPKP